MFDAHLRRSGCQKSDYRHCWLLCARHKRPSCRAAEQCDDIAPFQLIECHWIAASRELCSISDGGHQVRTGAVQDFRPVYVRFGSFADIRQPPEEGPLHPRNRTSAAGPWHVRSYSMTSSARSKTDCGIARPSDFAVCMLMTISILVGCSTGMSAGVVTLRILSTNSAARRKSCRRSGRTTAIHPLLQIPDFRQ